jgi:hypothetical protein
MTPTAQAFADLEARLATVVSAANATARQRDRYQLERAGLAALLRQAQERLCKLECPLAEQGIHSYWCMTASAALGEASGA